MSMSSLRLDPPRVCNIPFGRKLRYDQTETIQIRDSSQDRDLTRPELVGFCIGKLQT